MTNHLDSVLVRMSESSFFHAREPSRVRLIFPLVSISGLLVYALADGHRFSTSNKIIWIFWTTWALILFVDAILAYARHYLDAPGAARPYYVRMHPGPLRVTWRVLTLLKLGLLLGYVGVVGFFIANLILLVR
jgi:uncharacterized iron-regulated membrane protein